MEVNDNGRRCWDVAVDCLRSVVVLKMLGRGNGGVADRDEAPGEASRGIFLMPATGYRSLAECGWGESNGLSQRMGTCLP